MSLKSSSLSFYLSQLNVVQYDMLRIYLTAHVELDIYDKNSELKIIISRYAILETLVHYSLRTFS